MDAGIIHISIFWCEVCDRTDQGRQADRTECVSCNADRIMRIHHFVWQILLWLCLCIWNLGRWNVCPISMGSEKSEKEASVGIRRNWTETSKNEIYSVISLNADLCIRIYRKSSTEPVLGKYFLYLYTGKIPDAAYLAGWIIFILILIGMCFKKDFSVNIYVQWEQSLHGYHYYRFQCSTETGVTVFQSAVHARSSAL